MGVTGSKSCAEIFNEQIAKIETISHICCDDDFKEHDLRRRKLVVSKTNKNGSRMQTETYINPWIHACEEQWHVFTHSGTKATMADVSHRAVPPGWSLEEFICLKDATEYACHVQLVHYPSYSAAQVRQTVTRKTRL